MDESLSIRETKELKFRHVPIRKTKQTLDRTVHEHYIEIAFDSLKQRDRILAHLKSCS